MGDDSDVKSSAVPAEGIGSVPILHVFTTSWNCRSRLWWCLIILQVPYMHRGCTWIYPCKHAFSQNKNQNFKDRVINMHTCIVIKEYFSYKFLLIIPTSKWWYLKMKFLRKPKRLYIWSFKLKGRVFLWDTSELSISWCLHMYTHCDGAKRTRDEMYFVHTQNFLSVEINFCS